MIASINYMDGEETEAQGRKVTGERSPSKVEVVLVKELRTLPSLFHAVPVPVRSLQGLCEGCSPMLQRSMTVCNQIGHLLILTFIHTYCTPRPSQYLMSTSP